MTEASQFPSTLNNTTIAEWLAALSQLKPVNASSLLNDGINQLRKKHISQPEALNYLIKLTPVTLHLSSSLVDAFTNAEADRGAIKISKLSLLLPRNLALAFHALFQKNNAEQRACTGYFTVQLIGHYLQLCANFQSLPSEKLWIISGEIFVRAEQESLLSQTVSSKVTEFKEQPDIEQVIKRNLLFSLCSMQKLQRNEVESVTKFCNLFAKHVQIIQENTTFSAFYWDYLKTFPAQKQHLNQPLRQYQIGISCNELILKSPDYNRLSDVLNESLYNKIMLTLTSFKKPLYDNIPAAPIIQRAITGLSEIHAFLTRLEKLQRINQLGSLAPDTQASNRMLLEPMDHEKSHFKSTQTILQPAENDEEISAGQTVKILRTNNSHFINIETHKMNFTNGDLILLIDKKKNLTLGIIRQQKLANTADSTQILVEKISQSIRTLCIENKTGLSVGLLLNNPPDHPSIILAYTRFQKGETLKHQDQQITLGNLLEYTPSLVHYRLSS